MTRCRFFSPKKVYSNTGDIVKDEEPHFEHFGGISSLGIDEKCKKISLVESSVVLRSCNPMKSDH